MLQEQTIQYYRFLHLTHIYLICLIFEYSYQSFYFLFFCTFYMSNQNLEAQSQLQKKKKMIATSIVAPLASVIAKYCVHPIDTIKSKIQARTNEAKHSAFKFGHSIELCKQTWKLQGIKGFFPGVTLSAFGSIIAFSAFMTAYERTKHYLQGFNFFKQYPALNHFVSGFAAQMASCIFWLPIDIIKQRMQVQSEVKIYSYSGPRQAMLKISRTQGIIGLYRAFGATLVFFGPATAIFFVCYEWLKKHFVGDVKNQSLWQSIICSSVAGAISGFLTTPLQMVKLRMQIQRADKALKGGSFENTLYGYRNIFHGLYMAYQKEGFYSLYKGAGLRVLFTIPSYALSMSLTQQFRRIAIKHNLVQPFL